MKKNEYDIEKYPFIKVVTEFFGVEDLSELHTLHNELCEASPLTQENEAETPFHKKFYTKLNSGWPEIKKVYEDFIHNEISKLFDESFLYQVFPSFRIQVPNQTAVSNWHYDSDEDHKHPMWEINFQIPLTKMFDTNCMWLESVPGLGDFSPAELETGQYLIFNGNMCRHGNKTNTTGVTRVSLDFRVLPMSRHDKNTEKQSYYGKKFAEGGYYSLRSEDK